VLLSSATLPFHFFLVDLLQSLINLGDEPEIIFHHMLLVLFSGVIKPDVPMSSPFILWCKEWWHLQPSITSGTNWKVYCLIFRKQHASVLWRSIGCSMAGPVN